MHTYGEVVWRLDEVPCSQKDKKGTTLEGQELKQLHLRKELKPDSNILRAII
jgi:hypothetical protein